MHIIPYSQLPHMPRVTYVRSSQHRWAPSQATGRGCGQCSSRFTFRTVLLRSSLWVSVYCMYMCMYIYTYISQRSSPFGKANRWGTHLWCCHSTGAHGIQPQSPSVCTLYSYSYSYYSSASYVAPCIKFEDWRLLLCYIQPRSPSVCTLYILYVIYPDQVCYQCILRSHQYSTHS